MRTLITLFLIVCGLLAYQDSDFDGVSDEKDQCPNTPMTDLIDQFGCSIVKIMNEDPIGSRYDVILGVSYDKADYGSDIEFETVTKTFQADVFFDEWSVQFSTSYSTFESNTSSKDTSGFNDTTLSVFYNYKPLDDKNLFLRFGTGVVFASQEAVYNKTDYFASINANYISQNYSLFCGYRYTDVGDENTPYVSFQNTSSFDVGVGYYLRADIYASLSYLDADSIIDNIEKIRNLSFYLFYGINNNWFMTASYSKGLSDATSDLSSNLRVGYYF